MADNIGNKAAHDYHLDIAPVQEGFYVKGAAHCDWGMKNRLSRLFDPKSGNTVMLAFDHGYIMGPTAGLERIDVVIPPDPLCERAHGHQGHPPLLHFPRRPGGQVRPGDL